MYGFINLNKPLGLTSHDCVAKVRRILKLKRVGHAGTLDPLASGVLPVAVGSATRLLQFLPTGKAYQARIRLGQVTTTDDLEGDVISACPAPDLALDTVKTALTHFVGEIQQVPPLFSAIQIDGKRLYKRAIAGETPDISPRTVMVHSIEVLDWYPGEFPELEVTIRCGGGTYIRAIARDLGHALGCGGTLAGLIRTASSGFDLTTSLTFPELEAKRAQGTLELLSVDHALGHIPAIELPDESAYRWCLGQTVTVPLLALSHSESWVRIYNSQQGFLGMAIAEPSSTDQLELRPKVVLGQAIQPVLGVLSQ